MRELEVRLAPIYRQYLTNQAIWGCARGRCFGAVGENHATSFGHQATVHKVPTVCKCLSSASRATYPFWGPRPESPLGHLHFAIPPASCCSRSRREIARWRPTACWSALSGPDALSSPAGQVYVHLRRVAPCNITQICATHKNCMPTGLATVNPGSPQGPFFFCVV